MTGSPGTALSPTSCHCNPGWTRYSLPSNLLINPQLKWHNLDISTCHCNTGAQWNIAVASCLPDNQPRTSELRQPQQRHKLLQLRCRLRVERIQGDGTYIGRCFGTGMVVMRWVFNIWAGESLGRMRGGGVWMRGGGWEQGGGFWTVYVRNYCSDRFTVTNFSNKNSEIFFSSCFSGIYVYMSPGSLPSIISSSLFCPIDPEDPSPPNFVRFIIENTTFELPITTSLKNIVRL